MRALAALAVMTALFYWKLTLTRQFTFLSSPDLIYQVLPWYGFQARAWHTGVMPLWDPYQWCGQSLAGQWQPGAMYPLNWLLFWMPLRGGKLNIDWWHWHFVGMHLLAAALMYAYCREGGRSRWASVLAGAGFSYGGYVGTTLWPQMMNGAVWTPLVFLFLQRGNAALCGAALGVALLAGHHQPVIFVALAVAAVLLARRDLRRLAAVVVFAGLVGAAALLPAWEYGSRAYRWVNLPSPVRGNQTVPYIAQQPNGLIPLSLLGLVAPLDRRTTDPFLGLAVVSLALLGVATGWQNRAVRMHSVLALGGLAYALGSYSVFQGVLYAVTPFLDKARSPGHAMLVCHFGLVALAAHGMDALGEAGVWKRRVVRGLAGAGGLGWVAALALVTPSDRGNSVLLAATVALLLAVAIHRMSRPSIVALMLIELAAGTNYLYAPRTDLEQLEQHQGVVNFLKAQARPFRFHADDQEIPYNLGDWEGLESTGGYLASVSADLFDFVGRDWANSGLWLNQTYLVAKEKTRSQQEEVYAEPGGLKVFRNPDAFPRAWVESGRGARPAPDPQTGSVEVTNWRLDRVAAQVRTRGTAVAVFADPLYPGWQVRVDSRPAKAVAAYGALRAVAVESGEHRVEWVYRPWLVWIGMGLSLIGLVAACGTGLWPVLR